MAIFIVGSFMGKSFGAIFQAIFPGGSFIELSNHSTTVKILQRSQNTIIVAGTNYST